MAICPATIWCIVAAELLAAVLLFRQAKRRRQPVAFWSGILTVGLILDAAIIGLGASLSEDALTAVSPARFIAHGLLIPLISPYAPMP